MTTDTTTQPEELEVPDRVDAILGFASPSTTARLGRMAGALYAEWVPDIPEGGPDWLTELRDEHRRVLSMIGTLMRNVSVFQIEIQQREAGDVEEMRKAYVKGLGPERPDPAKSALQAAQDDIVRDHLRRRGEALADLLAGHVDHVLEELAANGTEWLAELEGRRSVLARIRRDAEAKLAEAARAENAIGERARWLHRTVAGVSYVPMAFSQISDVPARDERTGVTKAENVDPTGVRKPVLIEVDMVTAGEPARMFGP